ncbi:MAG: hypothetical protein ACT4PK_01985 [Gammaproteobacteria bacterium]
MFSRAYVFESLGWVALFVVAIEASKWVAASVAGESPLRLAALLPVLLVIGLGMWVELRQIARMDELQRLKYLVATLAGAMLAMLFCAVAYVGEALKLWARVAPIYAILALGVGFAIGWYGARRRYG